MKAQYLSPESESVSLLAGAFVCQSGIDGGAGTIDTVSEVDLNDEVWPAI